MESRMISYKSSRVLCRSFGSGNKMALCFHGYGETAESFSFLEKYVGSEYRFYAIDLPFHGNTEWNEGLNFTADDVLQILKEIPGLMEQRLTLIGFSLGGRVALSLYELIPEKIEKMILMAPDGLKINFWYWLTTQTLIGNKLFAFTMKHPDWFFAFLKLINKIGFVNTSIFKFVSYYIGNEKVREQLYSRWTALRKLKPSLSKIKSLIRKYHTGVHLVNGKYDRIILPDRGKKFQEGIEEFCSIQIIRSGHQVLHENHIKEILPAILTKAGNE